MMKRTIPMLLAMAAGIVMILAYFFPPLTPLQDKTTVWFNILAAVAFILAAVAFIWIAVDSNEPSSTGAAATED